MQISYVELFGYLASGVIAYSLTRNSIVKLRWFNLFGASSFCAYGVIIGAFPVALLNGFIAITNVYFLTKIMSKNKPNFAILPVNRPSNYIDFFLESHEAEIKHFFPRFMKTAELLDRQYFFLTEHTNVVGMLAGMEDENGCFIVDFDFVVPAYRDYKLGEFVIGSGNALIDQFGFKSVGAKADSPEHEQYLSSIGYTPSGKGIWRRQAI